MTDFLNTTNEKGLPNWELRLGINSGSLIAEVIDKNKFACDIWGDSVNTASCLESCGEVGKANILENTHKLAKDFLV